jgi:[acyl-carrier-protein] S-malonyltransferase
MSKVAFVFPGQGAQYVGMGRDIVEHYTKANKIFQSASNILGYDIKKICFEGPEEELKKTENTQPAILTTCIAIAQVLIEGGITPDVSAGLSLGEYASLVIAGVIDFEDAVLLVKKRGKYMQEAVPIGLGTMAAILGLERSILENDVLEKAQESGIVGAANFNSPGQIVISGEVNAVAKACEIAKEMGAVKAVPLAVSAPFHCSMLIPAGEKLAMELENTSFNEFKVPVISNATADYYPGKGSVKELLTRQVSNSILWEDTVVRMIKDGVDTFIEVGPGNTLSKFIKRISRNLKTKVFIYNIEDSESLKKIIKEG